MTCKDCIHYFVCYRIINGIPITWADKCGDFMAKQEPCKVSEYDKDHIWYKGCQYISLRRFLEVKAEAEQEPTTRQSCENCKQDQKECGNDAHYGFCQNWEYEVRCNSRKGNCVECVEQFICEEPCEEKKKERANETDS